MKLWGVSLHCSGGQQTEGNRTLKEMGFDNRKSELHISHRSVNGVTYGGSVNIIIAVIPECFTCI